MTKPTRTAIGNIPKGIDKELREFLGRLKQHVEVANKGGNSGLERYVTIRDLVDLELASVVARHGDTALNSLLGGQVTLAPGTGSTRDLSPPPPLTDVQVTSTARSIIVTWDGTQFLTYGHTEIWRAQTDDLGQAVLAGTSIGRIYLDSGVDSAVTYYYWVRAISIYDPDASKGPFNAVAGTSAGIGLIGGQDLSDLIVTASKLADGAVEETKMAALAVGNAAIKNLAVTDSKIADLSADKLFVAVGTIAEALIGNAEITDAMIGNIIQSTTYDPGGGVGWQLNKAGGFECAQITIRDSNGDIILTSGGQLASSIANIAQDWSDVNNRPTDTELSAHIALLEVFDYDNVSDIPWTNYSGAAEMSLQPGGITGGQILRVGNNSGNDMFWGIFNKSIAYNPDRLYRITARVRQTAGGGSLYIGIAGRNADDTQFVNISGGDSHSSQHYFAANAVSASGVWTEYTGYFTGAVSSGAGGYRPDPNNPGNMNEDAKYIRPLILAQYNSQTGITEIDYISIQVVDDTAQWSSIFGSNKPADNADVTSSSPQSPSWLSSPVVWSGNKVTSTNISTFIADLAVNSLQLAGQAVTIPTSAYTDSFNELVYPFAGVSPETILTLTFTSTGAPVLLSGVLNVQNTSGGDDAFFIYIYKVRSGVTTTIYSPSHYHTQSDFRSTAVSFSITDTPGIGAVTYQIRAKASSDRNYATIASIVALEVKK